MTNPKIMSVGAEAKLLHLFGIVHCSKNLTDGFVSEKIAPTLGRFAGIGDYDTAVVQLVEAGLWDETEGGYNVHDYLEYNYSKAEIETLREERKEAGRRGGQAKASKSLALAKQKSSTCLANPIALAKQKSSKTLAKSYPITHNPLPITHKEETTSSADADVAQAQRPPSEPLDPALSQVLVLFQAKRFANPAQRSAYESLLADLGSERLLELATWAAQKGISRGDAIAAIKGAAKKRRAPPPRSEPIDTSPIVDDDEFKAWRAERIAEEEAWNAKHRRGTVGSPSPNGQDGREGDTGIRELSVLQGGAVHSATPD
jgi:hypothetical protein